MDVKYFVSDHLTTEEVIIATLKVISATTKVILATNKLVSATEKLSKLCYDHFFGGQDRLVCGKVHLCDS